MQTKPTLTGCNTCVNETPAHALVKQAGQLTKMLHGNSIGTTSVQVSGGMAVTHNDPPAADWV